METEPARAGLAKGDAEALTDDALLFFDPMMAAETSFQGPNPGWRVTLGVSWMTTVAGPCLSLR